MRSALFLALLFLSSTAGCLGSPGGPSEDPAPTDGPPRPTPSQQPLMPGKGPSGGELPPGPTRTLWINGTMTSVGHCVVGVTLPPEVLNDAVSVPPDAPGGIYTGPVFTGGTNLGPSGACVVWFDVAFKPLRTTQSLVPAGAALAVVRAPASIESTWSIRIDPR